MTTRNPPRGPNELALMIRSWRRRLRPEDIPGFSAPYASSRGRTHASKELVASLTEYSLGWYSALERGDPQNYSEDFLEAVARVLQLSDPEKDHLFILAAGHEAPAHHGQQMQRSDAVQRLIDVQPWPAYINDDAWDLIAYNDHMRRWFPWVTGPETNIMRWAFTSPDAKTTLHNWATEWGPKMYAQMQYAIARHPDNKRLATLIEEILERSEDARRFRNRPLTYPHSDGDRRPVHLPGHRSVQRVELITLEPLRAPGSRCMMLIPTDL